MKLQNVTIKANDRIEPFKTEPAIRITVLLVDNWYRIEFKFELNNEEYILQSTNKDIEHNQESYNKVAHLIQHDITINQAREMWQILKKRDFIQL